MQFPQEYFEDEVINGFFVSSMMKRCHAAAVEVLEDIDRVCAKHGITYFAAWGTLLGAWRHQGFIPWDDDVDICMLRPDYEKFLSVVKEELGEWYIFSSFDDISDDYNNNVGCLHSGNRVRKDKAYLDKFHGYPYVIAVDIFAYDYVAPTEALDAEQIEIFTTLVDVAQNYEDLSRSDRRSVLRQVEDKFHVKIDQEKSIINQLWILAAKVGAQYKKGDYVTSMWHRANRRRKRGEDFKWPARCFEKVKRVPFEGLMINVPEDWETVLGCQYKFYQVPVRRGGAHEYPSYRHQEALWEEIGGTPVYDYFQFDAAKLPVKEERPLVVRDLVAGLLTMLTQVGAGLPDLIKENKTEAIYLLEDIQDAVISIGTNIETMQGEGHPTVACLERYCEALYVLHEDLMTEVQKQVAALSPTMLQPGALLRSPAMAAAPMQPATPALTGKIKKEIAALEATLEEVTASAHKEILDRKEIVFLPLKAKDWPAMASVYEAAKADPACDVYVIPLPYHAIGLDAMFDVENMIDETEDFPPGVVTHSALNFPWEQHALDVVYIQDPYDADSMLYRVYDRFFSDKLAAMAGKLIYIPTMLLKGYGPKDIIGRKGLAALTNTAGVAHADLVIVQNANVRNAFIDNLADWAGEDTRPLWEKKILNLGSPLVDTYPMEEQVVIRRGILDPSQVELPVLTEPMHIGRGIHGHVMKLLSDISNHS